MAKQAVFLIVDHGIDGRDKETIRFASLDEAERDRVHSESKNRAYLSTVDRVVDLDARRKTALEKLDGLDFLALGLTPAKRV